MNLAIARRRPSTNRVISVRALVPADLEFLRQRSCRTTIRYIRDAHHNIARLKAAGLKNKDIAARLGYTESRISVLCADPSLVELIATYRTEVHDSWRESVDSFNESAVLNMRIGERMITDRLEAADEGTAPEVPLRELLALTSDRMDRFGYGKRQTNLNVNVDFAKRLEAAISRSQQSALPPKVIDND